VGVATVRGAATGDPGEFLFSQLSGSGLGRDDEDDLTRIFFDDFHFKRARDLDSQLLAYRATRVALEQGPELVVALGALNQLLRVLTTQLCSSSQAVVVSKLDAIRLPTRTQANPANRTISCSGQAGEIN
jgi:hypothetical protein